MITCIAIDDEPLALKQITGYIEQVPFLKIEGSFSGALKALNFLQENKVDLMFVDINMPNLSGMEFVKSLVNPPKIVFTTAYREYAAEGFQVDAADYLVKPISFAKFLKAVEKVRLRYFSETEVVNKEEVSSEQQTIQLKEQFLFIKTEYKIVRINLNDIKYIEGMRDYVRFHIENNKPIMALLSMKSLVENLPSDVFMRVHRSYIVNLDKIQTIERNRIIFDKDVYIPVGEKFNDDFQNYLNNNFLK